MARGASRDPGAAVTWTLRPLWRHVPPDAPRVLVVPTTYTIAIPKFARLLRALTGGGGGGGGGGKTVTTTNYSGGGGGGGGGRTRAEFVVADLCRWR